MSLKFRSYTGYPLQRNKVNVVIDGQWGSTGKGKLTGYLALRSELDLVTCDFAPNAGHTWRGFLPSGLSDSAGSEHTLVTRQIPTSCVNRDAAIGISAGSAIDVDLLLKEIEMLSFLGVGGRLVIDYRAAIVEPHHVVTEKGLTAIASTGKGCGASLADKVMRRGKRACDEPRLAPWIGDVSNLAYMTLKSGGTVLAESAQGFDLSLNHGTKYPFVTSRDVTPATVLNHIGVPVQQLGEVIGCLRTYPIRVGNVYDPSGVELGNSGPCYEDQTELTWDQLRQVSNSPYDVTEKTTVTGRTRRVFSFSHQQYAKFAKTCQPTQLFVNFANHLDFANTGVREFSLLTDGTRKWINELETRHTTSSFWPPACVRFVGTGARDEDMVEV